MPPTTSAAFWIPTVLVNQGQPGYINSESRLWPTWRKPPSLWYLCAFLIMDIHIHIIYIYIVYIMYIYICIYHIISYHTISFYIYIHIISFIYIYIYIHVRTHTHIPRYAYGMDMHGRSWASLKSGRKSQNGTLLEEDGEITRSPGAGPCSMERWLALDNSASGVIKHGWETPGVNGGFHGKISQYKWWIFHCHVWVPEGTPGTPHPQENCWCQESRPCECVFGKHPKMCHSGQNCGKPKGKAPSLMGIVK